MRLGLICASAILSIDGASLAQNPPAQVALDATMSAGEARAIASEFAKLLEERYFYPSIGRLYAERVRFSSARGEYDRISSASALAEQLTADVQRVAPDNHLAVRVRGQDAFAPPATRAVQSDADVRSLHPPLVPGAGKPIEELTWIAPGVAYARFTSFPSRPDTMTTVDEFMKGHAEAKAMIFDLRTSRGGGPGEMDVIFSYLFGEGKTLIHNQIRASMVDKDARLPPTMRAVQGHPGVVTHEHFVIPNNGERRLRGTKIFVLVSELTRSAAEHFAFALKATGRGTVIGIPTAGAGNFAFGPVPVGQRFTAFIPLGRSIDPRTGKGWEGIGVQPDVLASPEGALVEALARVGIRRAEAQLLSRKFAPLQSMARPTPPVRYIPPKLPD